MKLPIFFAHGQQVLACLLLIVLAALVVSFGSLVCGLRKKRENISVIGTVLGSISVLYGLWVVLALGVPTAGDVSAWLIGMFPLPVGLVGLGLSLWRRPKMPDLPE